MTTVMQIGDTARDRADFCRCFKTGAAVFLHNDGMVAHSTYRNTLRTAYMPANVLRHARLQAFRNTNAMAVHARRVVNPFCLRLSVTSFFRARRIRTQDTEKISARLNLDGFFRGITPKPNLPTGGFLILLTPRDPIKAAETKNPSKLLT